MKLSESLGLQGELLYTTAGNRTIYDNLLLSGEADFNLNYIQVPVMLTLRPVNVLSLHGGFYAAYLTSAVTSYEGDLVNSFAELDRDNFNDIDYGFVAGAAINLDRLQLGLRYNLGLNQVANSDIASDFLGDSKNVIGQVYISIKL